MREIGATLADAEGANPPGIAQAKGSQEWRSSGLEFDDQVDSGERFNKPTDGAEVNQERFLTSNSQVSGQRGGAKG